MSPDQINALADEAATRAVEKYAEQHKCAGCLCEGDMDKHEKEHEFLRELIGVFKRVNEIKWGVIKTIVTAAVLGGLALVGFKIKP